MNTIMVVGLGSMGNRRLRLLRGLRPNIKLCGVDRDASRCDAARERHGINTYAEVREAIKEEHPEAAVISTSPLAHAAVIKECLAAGLHVFTELNLVPDGYEENMRLAQEKDRVLFLSSTFLYREENRYIIRAAKDSGAVLNYRYHVGQYLPDWHPWESYRDYFVGDTRTNGCRELFAIELPWLCAAFGPIEEAQVQKAKTSSLHIAYPDSYMVLLKHKNGHMGSICVDVVSRKAGRQFELYGEDLYLTWGGTPDTLIRLDTKSKLEEKVSLYDSVDHKEGYASFVVENAYEEELRTFLRLVEEGGTADYGFSEDLETLRWINQIELVNR